MSAVLGAGGADPLDVDGRPGRPLTRSEVERLRTGTPRDRLRVYARWLVLAGGVILFFVAGSAIPQVPCTVAVPCGGDVPGNLIFGLLGAVPLLGLVHLGTAAGASALVAVAMFWYDRTEPGDLPLWVHLLLAAYAIGALLLAARVRTDRPGTAVEQWPEAAPRLTPPAPTRLRRPSLRPLAWPAALLLAGALLAGWTVDRQATADERLRRAEVVPGTVRSHPAVDVIAVDLPAGRPGLTLTVLTAADYPVGSTVRVAVDDGGLRQLLTEPYDASGWLMMVGLLCALGLGSGVRFAVRLAARRRLFRQPQPVYAVLVRRRPGRAYVYPAQGVDPCPLAQIVVPDLAPATGDAPLEPALLYGVPLSGQWCTVAVGRSVLSPSRPLTEVVVPEWEADGSIARRSGFFREPKGAGRVHHDPATAGGGETRKWTPETVPRRPTAKKVRPDRKPAREARPGTWPELGWLGGTVFLVLVLGAIVAGIVLRAEFLTGLAGTVCTDGGCSPVGMAATGWAVGGLPLLLLGAVCARFGPTRPTVLAAVLLLPVLTFGLTTILGGDEAVPLSEVDPDLVLFVPGFAATWVGLLIGAVLGGILAASPLARMGAPDGWLAWMNAARLVPMLFTAAVQLPALLVALISAAG